jgi:hypothetical protein
MDEYFRRAKRDHTPMDRTIRGAVQPVACLHRTDAAFPHSASNSCKRAPPAPLATSI